MRTIYRIVSRRMVGMHGRNIVNGRIKFI
jgi:hypothetical protein